MALDRKDILTALNNLFEGDATLMAMLKTVSIDEVKFNRAAADVDNNYRMYMRARPIVTISNRSQNIDYQVIVEYIVTSNTSDPQVGKDLLDDIDIQVQWLVSNEMWTGNRLTSDSTSNVYDMDWEAAEDLIDDEETALVVDTQGIINVFINRLRS